MADSLQKDIFAFIFLNENGCILNLISQKIVSVDPANDNMPCTAQLGGPVLKATGRVQYTPFGLGFKSTMITEQHTVSKPIKPTNQALTLINLFHKRHFYIIVTLQ